VTPARITGRIEETPYPESKRARKKYVKTCGKSEEKNLAWEEFVWVRAN